MGLLSAAWYSAPEYSACTLNPDALDANLCLGMAFFGVSLMLHLHKTYLHNHARNPKHFGFTGRAVFDVIALCAPCAPYHARLQELLLGPHGVQFHITSALEHLPPTLLPGNNQHLCWMLHVFSQLLDHQWLVSGIKPAFVCSLLDIIRYGPDPKPKTYFSHCHEGQKIQIGILSNLD